MKEGRNLSDILTEQFPKLGIKVSFAMDGHCHIDYYSKHEYSSDITMALRDFEPKITSYTIQQHKLPVEDFDDRS